MTEHEPIIEHLHTQTRDQVHLAVIAEAAPVAEMHLELALFSSEQARVAERLGEGD